MDRIRLIVSAAAVTVIAPCVLQSPAAASSPPQYTLTVIGGFPHTPAFGPISMPQALNDLGQVVGYGAITPSGTSGLSWQQGNLVNLGIPSGFDRSYANRVNALGQIVGGATRSNGTASAAVYWSGTSMVELGTLGGQHAAALGINDHSRVVGFSRTTGDASMRAFSWRDGTMTQLSKPTWATDTIAYDVSNSGHIVGLASSATTTRPILWQSGILTQLPVPAGTRAGTAVAVNEQGMAVGHYELDLNGRFAASVWNNGLRIDLGFLSSTEYAIAADINDMGHVVGTAAGEAGMTGFIWQTGVMYDLRSLLVPSFAGYQITSARSINSSGQIAAVALVGGRETAVVLTPVPAPGAWVMVIVAGLVASRRKR